MTKSKAGVAIDEWKLPIFERHLKQSGYAFENVGRLASTVVNDCQTILLRIDTTNLVALGEVLKAANTEAAKTKATINQPKGETK